MVLKKKRNFLYWLHVDINSICYSFINTNPKHQSWSRSQRGETLLYSKFIEYRDARLACVSPLVDWYFFM